MMKWCPINYSIWSSADYIPNKERMNGSVAMMNLMNLSSDTGLAFVNEREN